VAVLLLGSALSGLIGYTAHSYFVEPVVVMPPPEVIKEELTEDELRELAEDLLASEKDKALTAQARVRTLQEELLAKEEELAKLRKTSKQTTGQSKKARKRINEEIAFLRVQLASAEEERDRLRKELKQTVKELDFQVAQSRKFKRKAKHYKMESTANLWSAFVANSKTKICDKGTKKRHAKCYAAVDAAMSSSIRSNFTRCVDTYQSVPVLKKKRKRGDSIPSHSKALPSDNKFTKKGWYVLFCDPSLPEAPDRDLEGDDVPTWQSTYGSGGQGQFNPAPVTQQPQGQDNNQGGGNLDDLNLDDFEL
jgi:Holliday junction resolvase